MSFFSKVGPWFKNFNTAHNWSQIGKVVVDAGEVAAAVTTKNVPSGVTAGEALAADAKGIKVAGDFPWNKPMAAETVAATAASNAAAMPNAAVTVSSVSGASK
jgi:hypothetical protein